MAPDNVHYYVLNRAAAPDSVPFPSFIRADRPLTIFHITSLTGPPTLTMFYSAICQGCPRPDNVRNYGFIRAAAPDECLKRNVIRAAVSDAALDKGKNFVLLPGSDIPRRSTAGTINGGAVPNGAQFDQLLAALLKVEHRWNRCRQRDFKIVRR